MGDHTLDDIEENEEFTPFRYFTRESLFNIERRIAEEKQAQVRQANEGKKIRAHEHLISKLCIMYDE